MLLTGATGYIGGRLLRRFEEGGRAVRCLARRRAAHHLSGRVERRRRLALGSSQEPRGDRRHAARIRATARTATPAAAGAAADAASGAPLAGTLDPGSGTPTNPIVGCGCRPTSECRARAARRDSRSHYSIDRSQQEPVRGSHRVRLARQPIHTATDGAATQTSPRPCVRAASYNRPRTLCP